MSCHRYHARRHAQRETWLKDCKLPYKYFLGKPTGIYQGTVPKDDEVFLDVDDGYLALPFKTHGAACWARAGGYGSVFKTDDETYVRLERLEAANPSTSLYVGRVESSKDGSWCNGGPGYWLSGDALRTVCTGTPTNGAEDIWVSHQLASHGINGQHDPRYVLPTPGALYPRPDNDIISYTGTCSLDGVPSMYNIHKEFNGHPDA